MKQQKALKRLVNDDLDDASKFKKISSRKYAEIGKENIIHNFFN